MLKTFYFLQHKMLRKTVSINTADIFQTSIWRQYATICRKSSIFTSTELRNRCKYNLMNHTVYCKKYQNVSWSQHIALKRAIHPLNFVGVETL